jgi:predicted DNA-binding transcriptional regulator YafY
MPRGDQLARQWRVLHILGARGGRTVLELAREIECSLRTLWRDLAVLQAAGFPLTTDTDGKESRYRLMEGPRGLPRIPFTTTELMGLHMGRHLLVPLRGTPAGESIHTALEKIAATLGPKPKGFLDRLQHELSARSVQNKDYRGSQEALRVVQDALQSRRTLEVQYHSYGRDALTRRSLDPVHLWTQQGGVYIAAFCHERQEVRTFALERFRHIRVTDDTFAPPADFDLERYLAGSLGLFRGRPVTVALRFSRSVARFVAERQWHPSQQAAPHLTGELDLTLQVPICPELTRWILSYGKEVEVLAPQSLRATIRTEWLAALRGPGGRVEPTPPAAKAGRPYRSHSVAGYPAVEGPATRPRRSPHSNRTRK